MVRIVASAQLPVPPARASALILNPKHMEKWLIGAQGLRADTGWPFHDTSLTWETDHGSGFCEARVVENMLPASLKVSVTTPTHQRIVTHKFTATPDGGTTYERVVDADLPLLRKLFGTGQIRSQIQQEVGRAAELVRAQAGKKG
jgi:uncharacterized protein YndB with AHSA1/START domain